MDEKTAVSDTLASVNSILNKLNYSIEQANDKMFRETCQNFRDIFEAVQWDVYEYAKQKQYYVPAAPAGQADIEQVKQSIQG